VDIGLLAGHTKIVQSSGAGGGSGASSSSSSSSSNSVHCLFSKEVN